MLSLLLLLSIVVSISVKLKPIFGISIPCIFRIGENTTVVSLSDLELKTINFEERILIQEI